MDLRDRFYAGYRLNQRRIIMLHAVDPVFTGHIRIRSAGHTVNSDCGSLWVALSAPNHFAQASRGKITGIRS
jgi:hypothetical protein